jgi:hypothetical protein
LLHGRLPGTLGYLDGEEFAGYKNLMEYFTMIWTSEFSLCKNVAVLLVVVGVGKNPGTDVEVERILGVCVGTAQVVEGGKCICDMCRSERLRLLGEKLQNALLQIDDLTMKNKALEAQLRMGTPGTEVTSGVP